MSFYNVLNIQRFSVGEYSIVPIRLEDRYKIMRWRNEQMYHLRQNELLTKQKQDVYFNQVISKLFQQEKPDQLLFSYLEGEECIGYGGLVHINWIDKNAEISFLMKTDLEKNNFNKHWEIYLNLIEKVAFNELNFHKLHTYAFDIRPKLYEVLDNANFIMEAVLKEHCFFNDRYIDIIIHSKFNKF